MSARKTMDRANRDTQPEHYAAMTPARALERRRQARIAAFLVGLALSAVGCAAEGDDPELAESEQALRASALADAPALNTSARPAGSLQQTASAGSWTAVQTGGTTVFGGGTTVVAFTQDKDGAWHCRGDADCNKMFLSGVCKGGILDSSCDTTSGVECWCY